MREFWFFGVSRGVGIRVFGFFLTNLMRKLFFSVVFEMYTKF